MLFKTATCFVCFLKLNRRFLFTFYQLLHYILFLYEDWIQDPIWHLAITSSYPSTVRVFRSFLVLHDLDPLDKSVGQVFAEYPWFGFIWYFLMIRPGLWILGENTIEVKCSLRASHQGICEIGMTYDWWWWPWPLSVRWLHWNVTIIPFSFAMEWMFVSPRIH